MRSRKLRWLHGISLFGARAGLCAAAAGLLAATAGAGESQSRERFVCSLHGTERLVDIYRVRLSAGGAGCRVDYTREGVTRQLWSASGDYGYCLRQALGLVTRLSEGNFACKPQTEPEPPADAP